MNNIIDSDPDFWRAQQVSLRNDASVLRAQGRRMTARKIEERATDLTPLIRKLERQADHVPA